LDYAQYKLVLQLLLKIERQGVSRKNGHTSSIMDYARFNYVAQPEDGVTALFPRIETMTNGLLNGVFLF
jgi:hypothetical protein